MSVCMLDMYAGMYLSMYVKIIKQVCTNMSMCASEKASKYVCMHKYACVGITIYVLPVQTILYDLSVHVKIYEHV